MKGKQKRKGVEEMECERRGRRERMQWGRNEQKQGGRKGKGEKIETRMSMKGKMG